VIFPSHGSWSAAAPERASSQATFQALLAQSDLAMASGQIGCRYVKVLAAAVRSFLKFAHSRFNHARFSPDPWLGFHSRP
jgi:hypothetical protein